MLGLDIMATTLQNLWNGQLFSSIFTVWSLHAIRTKVMAYHCSCNPADMGVAYSLGTQPDGSLMVSVVGTAHL